MGIDITTGNLSLDRVDLALAGPIVLSAGRTWLTESLRAAPGELGRGWRPSLDFRLRPTLSGWTYETPSGERFDLEDTRDAFAETGKLLSLAHGIELRRVDAREIALCNYGHDRAGMEFRFRDYGGTWRLHAFHRQDRVRVEFRWRANRIVSAWQTRNQRGLQFVHDDAGRLMRVEAITATGARLGPRVAYEYDARGRLALVHDEIDVAARYEYDDFDRVRSELDRSGRLWVFNYDRNGRCVRAADGDGRNTRSLCYEPEARQTVQSDSHGEDTIFTYDSGGRVLSRTSPLGLVEVTGYDELGRLATRMDPDGFAISYTYDELGRLARATFPRGNSQEFEYDDAHRRVGYRDWRGHETRLIHDADGNLLRCELPGGGRWVMEYNEFGELARIVEPAGGETRYTWDDFGRITSRREPGGGLWSFVYDALGRMIEERDPAGGLTRHEWDARHRVTRSQFPDGSSVASSYDHTGTVIRERRSDGAERWIQLNPCGEVLAACDYSGRVTHFDWDTEQGRLLGVRSPGATHRFEYDADGFPIKHTRDDADSLEFMWSQGRLSARIDSAGRRWSFEYDDLGFVSRIDAGDDDWVGFEINPLHCDLGAITTKDASVRYERDIYGDVIAEIQGERRIEYGLDASARSVSLSLAGQAPISWELDDAGNCTALRYGELAVTSELDAFGREIARDHHVGARSVGELRREFDPLGRMTAQRYAPRRAAARGFERRFRHDAAGHLAAIQDSLRGWRRCFHGPTGKLLVSDLERGTTEFEGYDRNENRTWHAVIADDHQTAQLHGRPQTSGDWGSFASDIELRGGEVVRFVHDELDRVVEARYPDRCLRYRWDRAGQLVEKTTWPLAGSTPDHRATFEWDGLGRLVAAEVDGCRWVYVYDGLDRRVRKIGPEGEVHEYVWSGDLLVYSTDGEHERMYLHRLGPDELVAVVDDGEPRFVVCDYVGAPSELLDRCGALIERIERETWGRVKGRRRFDAGFRNQWLDAETGLFYTRYRYYDADIGRFVSPDPLRLAAGFNFYRYAPSPLIFADPMGLMPKIHEFGGQLNDSPVFLPEEVSLGNKGIGMYGGPHLTGVDTITVTGKGSYDINVGSNTLASMKVGNTTVLHAYNGYTQGQGGNEGIHWSHNMIAQNGWTENFKTTWHHAEINLMAYAINNSDNKIFKQSGDVLITISRPPCHRDKGTGCDISYKKHAQQLADNLKKSVTVQWVAGKDGNGNPVYEKSKPFTPGC